MANSKYLILACDGGGIRGLITALLLQQLGKEYPDFLKQTYLYAGTSTGGIISLALACNVSADDLVTLYGTDGAQIFTPSACISGSAPIDKAAITPPAPGASSESWWEFILEHLAEIICAWYTNTGLKSAIETKLGSSATATLNSLVPPPPANQYVLVNTLQLCNSSNVWTPLQLTNLPNISGNDSGNSLVIDAAMSTSAAPMYFPPYNHPTYGYCADGGLFANNPGTIALTTLIESGIALQDIWMLSLSTGNTLDCYPASIINMVGAGNFGPLFWFWPVSQPYPAVTGQPYTPSLPLMAAFFDATAEIDASQCAQLLGAQFQRARVPLSQPIALDDYSPASITAMTNSTDNYMQTSAEWAGIESWIETNFG
jgi:hypothetical protein